MTSALCKLPKVKVLKIDDEQDSWADLHSGHDGHEPSDAPKGSQAAFQANKPTVSPSLWSVPIPTAHSIPNPTRWLQQEEQDEAKGKLEAAESELRKIKRQGPITPVNAVRRKALREQKETAEEELGLATARLTAMESERELREAEGEQKGLGKAFICNAR